MGKQLEDSCAETQHAETNCAETDPKPGYVIATNRVIVCSTALFR